MVIPKSNIISVKTQGYYIHECKNIIEKEKENKAHYINENEESIDACESLMLTYKFFRKG